LRNLTGVAVLAVLLVAPWCASRAVAQTAPTTGRVDGIATVSTQLAKSRRRMRIYTEPGQRAAPESPPEQPFANVVIYLESAPQLNRAQGSAVPGDTMRQHGALFVPYVLPIMVGTTVEFTNDDPFYHNVFSLSRVREFDLGRYPRGESKQVRFPKAGVVQVFCHIHADMSAYILVLDNPFYVIPDAQGHFALENIPPGDYRLVTWHERIRPIFTPIRVDVGKTTSLRLHIPLPDASPK